MSKKRIFIVTTMSLLCLCAICFTIYNYYQYTYYKNDNLKLEEVIKEKENLKKNENNNLNTLNEKYNQLLIDKAQSIERLEKWNKRNLDILKYL